MKRFEKIEKIWSDAQKQKGKVSSYIRRAKIINPIVYSTYSVFGLGYLVYIFYDLFAAQNAIPNWLPFGWLHTIINQLPYPLLISSLFLVAIPALLGVLLKILVRFPSNTDIPKMPDKPYLLRKDILDIIDENNVLRGSIKNPLYLFIILTAIAVGLAVIYGVQTKKWLEAVLYVLLCGAVLLASYFATVSVGSEKGGSEKRETQYKDALKYSKTFIVQICVSLLNDDKFTEVAEIAGNYNYLYGYRGDTYVLQLVARGMTDFKAAAEAIGRIKCGETFDYPEVGEIVQRLTPRLMENAKIHYAESEKEADLCLADKNWAGVRAALAGCSLSGNYKIKYTYAVLMDDPELTFDEVKWYADYLDRAENEGFSSDCEDMLFVCRSEIYKWAAAYNVVFTQKAASATRDTSTKHMSILDARAKLKRIIADPNLSLAEKEAAVKAHNNEHLDHISIRNGCYYNFSEE